MCLGLSRITPRTTLGKIICKFHSFFPIDVAAVVVVASGDVFHVIDVVNSDKKCFKFELEMFQIHFLDNQCFRLKM
jgi:hypothetical protein